jgi:hypothetical protein
MSVPRRSDETDRTQVPTRVNSSNHLDVQFKESGLETIPSRTPNENQQRRSSVELDKDVENRDHNNAAESDNDTDDDMNPDHINPDEKDPNLIV